uniref:UPF0400 protein C337.03 isoform X2 n=1 Tax=Rhizophora mucronata TaxID=61149 RepID=A0A2P2KHY3_RHIMU
MHQCDKVSIHCWVLLSLESLSASICSLNTLFIATPRSPSLKRPPPTLSATNCKTSPKP